MVFVDDPKNRFGVCDPENNFSLSSFLRDVPSGERWFTCRMGKTEFLVETDYCASTTVSEHTYTCYLEKIERRLRFSERMRGKSPSDLMRDVVPPLREAIKALDRRWIFVPLILESLTTRVSF